MEPLAWDVVTPRRLAAPAPWVGLVAALLLVAAAIALPKLAGWHPHVKYFPPLHAAWDPRVGPGTVPAVLLAVLGAWQAVPLARRLSWGRLLVAVYVSGLAWMLALATVDGRGGIGTILDTRYEYLPTARATTDFPAVLREFVARIPFDGRPDDIPQANWPPHVAGHPPGALGFFVLLDRLGLGSGLAAGVVVTLLAATTAVAVLVTLRLLGAEQRARQAAPFLVLGPAAVWQSVSADGMFAAVAAWGMAALAAGAVRRSVAWSALAGLLLGYCVLLSYGLPLLGVLAVAVLLRAGSWRPLPWAAVTALGVVLVFAALGFSWWEGLGALHQRYFAGVASHRPPAYWVWGNLAALVCSAGPLLGAGVAMLARRTTSRAAGTVRVLSLATVVMVLLADASQMSRAEVERIWLPFVPWLLIACALLPERWRRGGLVVQVVWALAVQHLLQTGW